ncbi:hypothetical protein LCGC14_2849580 [marine sediment metagenome]|uniref:Uncharacterized protein n=1 Tax=marine sediment metagenome TaxID=412755 RepID=A0A0F8Y8Y6_9ZZZZ
MSKIANYSTTQMAILDTEMVSIEQIFLPYMQIGDTKTLYEVMVDHKLALPSGQ